MAEARTAPLTQEDPAPDIEFEETEAAETALLILNVARARAAERLGRAGPLRSHRTPTPLPRFPTTNSTGEPPPAGKDQSCAPEPTTDDERAAEEAGAARGRRRLTQIGTGTS